MWVRVMAFVKNYHEQIEVLAKASPLLFIFFGTVAFFVPPLLGMGDVWSSYFRQFGGLLVVSGVFSATVHAFRILGLVKEELLDIVYDNKYLVGRKDIYDIWQNVSVALYNRKFPEISEDICAVVSRCYFPQGHRFYYRNYYFRSIISCVDDERRLVRVEDYSSFELVYDVEEEGVLKRSFKSVIKKNKHCEKTSFEVEYIKIDGELQDIERVDSGSDDYFLKKEYTYKIPAKGIYLIEKKVVKVYDCHVDRSKSFTFNAFCRGFSVHVEHPQDVKLDFHPLGVVDKYQDRADNSKSVLWRDYPGLVLPRQGFLIVYYQ